MSITFSVDDVERATEAIPSESAKAVVDKLFRSETEAYYVPSQHLISADTHPLVAAIHYAYAQHYPLSLSPDHIWLTLCQGLAQHINAHAEELRGGIVKHQGKSPLHVIRPDFQRGNPKNPWPEVFALFSKLIRVHIGEELHDIFTPQFSTTTPTIKAAYEVTLMDAMQAYFTYMVTMCGIPEIKLEGTVEDWELIAKQIEKFRQFKLDWWVNALQPILAQFVNTAKGKIDREFWSSIYKLRDSSGGPFISGWILKLFPYLKQEMSFSTPSRNPFVETEPAEDHPSGLVSDKFPTGINCAPVKCKNATEEWELSFLAGFIGIAQDASTLTIRPEIGWAIRDETTIIEAKRAKSRTLRQKKYTDSSACFFDINSQMYAIQRIGGIFYVGETRSGKDMRKLPPIEHFIRPETGWTDFEHEEESYRYDATKLTQSDVLHAIEEYELQDIINQGIEEMFAAIRQQANDEKS